MSDTAVSNSLNVADLALKATVTFAAKQYFGCVAHTVAGEATLAGANAALLGVVQNKPAAGEAASIRTARGVTTLASCGAAVTAGDRIITDGNGQFITAAGAAQKVCGVALSSTTAINELFEMMLVDGYVA